jgi:peptidoglycan/xylan/chitin deacetylase (PgdA/CDA1 family)
VWRELAARILTVGPIRASLARAFRAPLLTCLTYHRVGDFEGPDTASASFAELEWQVAYLRRHVRVLDGNETLACIQGRAPLDGPAVCLTFDDGYVESLRIGELLARHSVPAIFFVVSDFVGTRTLPDWYRIEYAAPRSKQSLMAAYMQMDPLEQSALADRVEKEAGVRAPEADRWADWPALRALHALGHTIGAHTRTHPILANLPPERQREELAGARRRIEEELGAPVTLLAYPYGGPRTFDAQTKKLAADCGYQAAFSLDGGRNRRGAIDPFEVRRMSVHRSRALFRVHAALPAIAELKRSVA